MSVEKRYRSRSRSKSKDASVSDKSSERSRSRSSSRGRDRDYDTTYRLHIADIGEGVTKRELERLYEQFGGLQEIWMANSPPCFGFAVFKKKSQAVAALKSTDGLSICGSRIRVTHAKPRTRGLGRRYFNPNMRCYECGNSGHFYRDCPDLSGKYGSRRNSHYPRRRRSYGNGRYERDRERERRYTPDRERERDRSPVEERDRRRRR